VVLFGSDHPLLTGEHIIKLINLLETDEVSIGPTEDGGFWGLATRVSLKGLFSQMDFKTPKVLDGLLHGLNLKNINPGFGDMLFDIDTKRDLTRWMKKENSPDFKKLIQRPLIGPEKRSTPAL
jgi:glycosyltransferase A (GT-A) superfamily protein (DUF2064 family)